MTDFPQTPEAVALSLLHRVADAERKILVYKDGVPIFQNTNEAWILDTYKRCLEAVRGVNPQGTETGKLPVHDADAGTWTKPE